MSAFVVIAAAVGWKALIFMYVWLGSCIIAAELSRSKGYGEKAGLGTGLILTILGPIIWLFVPPKDELAEWHTRKPWQRRKVIKTDPGTIGKSDSPAGGGRDSGKGSPPAESSA